MSFLDTIKNKVLIKNNFFSMILVLVIFFLDRFTKVKILEHNLDGSTLFINDYLNYTLVWNTGIGFGLLSFGESSIYNIVTFFIILYFISKISIS